VPTPEVLRLHITKHCVGVILTTTTATTTTTTSVLLLLWLLAGLV
jgi:hypothetical protein